MQDDENGGQSYIAFEDLELDEAQQHFNNGPDLDLNVQREALRNLQLTGYEPGSPSMENRRFGNDTGGGGRATRPPSHNAEENEERMPKLDQIMSSGGGGRPHGLTFPGGRGGVALATPPPSHNAEESEERMKKLDQIMRSGRGGLRGLTFPGGRDGGSSNGNGRRQ